MRISTPVADLRAAPEHLSSTAFAHNPLRLTQLTYGEAFTPYRQEGEWIYGGAPEQLRFTPTDGWHPYPGWLHCTELTHAPPLPLPPLHLDRPALITQAHTFLGAPYLWGGKSPYSQNPIGSVDCSGLIYLLYRTQGLLIPRDAHDQYLKATPIAKADLLPGDLLFWAPADKPDRITHVVLYHDRATYLEAPESHKPVRRLPLPPTFWTQEAPFFSYPDRPKTYLTFFGRFIP